MNLSLGQEINTDLNLTDNQRYIKKDHLSNPFLDLPED